MALTYAIELGLWSALFIAVFWMVKEYKREGWGPEPEEWE